MENYKLIDLNEYVQTGEGGSSLTYTHKTRHALAKLFNPGAEAEILEQTTGRLSVNITKELL